MELTSRQRQHLKGLAHKLKPVVHVGKDGLSEPCRRQVDEALDAHELIKVKLTDGAPIDRNEASEQLPGSVGAFLVQNIGKVFVLYRPHPEKPRIELPWPVAEGEGEGGEDFGEGGEDPRRPRPRAEGTLLGSVRERGGGGRAMPVPPPRPKFEPRTAVAVPAAKSGATSGKKSGRAAPPRVAKGSARKRRARGSK